MKQIIEVAPALFSLVLLAFCAGLQWGYLKPKLNSHIFNIGWGWFWFDVIGAGLIVALLLLRSRFS